ncbi:MAG: pantoate--beta-alanine ligase [Thermodesulfobacteriota bacterium]
MRQLSDPNKVQEYCLHERSVGKKIGLVPTMGCFHQGHLSLMSWAAEHCDMLIVSLFVNPAQFGPEEDLDSYPRTLEKDRELAQEQGVDILFVPDEGLMYPPGYDTWVHVPGVSADLCGASRPGHFRGVGTVVCKLLNICRPHLAVFGQKDWQQLAVIKRMAADLNIPTKIVGHPVVRETDGLAMSSRNTYLTPGERQQAAQIYAGLRQVQEMFEGGERRCGELVACFSRHVKRKMPDARMDYAKVVDPESAAELDEINGSGLLAVAVYLGRARLIDNMLFEENR